jgi:hypothetical protein
MSESGSETSSSSSSSEEDAGPQKFDGAVSCLGLAQDADTQPLLVLCCQQPKKPLQFYLTRLDHLSAPLLSPFFEHDVALEEADAPLVFRLTAWKAARFRISSDVRDEKLYAERVRDVLRHSFFLVMEPPLSADAAAPDWARTCLDWQCRRWPLATTHVPAFELGEWTTKEVSPSVYWSQFCARFQSVLLPLLKGADLGCKTAVAHDLAHLDTLLERWPGARHVAGYLRYRLCDMPLVRAVYARGVTEVGAAHLDVARLRDLDLLYRALSGEPDVPAFADMDALLGVTVRDARLAAAAARLCAPFEALVERVALPWMLDQCARRARASPGSVYPVTVRYALHLVDRLFGGAAERELTQLELWADSEQVELDLVDGAAPEPAVLLNCFQRHLTGRPADDLVLYRRAHHPRDARITLHATANLAYVHVKPAQLRAESQLHAHLTVGRTVQCTVDESPTTWDAAAARADFHAMDPLLRDLFALRVHALTYRAVELAAPQPPDVRALTDALAGDVHSCLVVVPPRSDYTRRRLRAHFGQRTERPLLGDLDARLHESDAPALGPLRPQLVIAPDAHLYSVDALLALFRWAEAARVRRLLMLGAEDTLPLHCDGQAWRDALCWASRGRWQPATLFQPLQLNDALDALIDAAVASRRLLLCTGRQLQERLVELMRRRTHRPSALRLYALERQPAKRRGATPLVQQIESALTLKFRGNNMVRLESVLLSELTQLPVGRQQAQGHGHYFFMRRADAALLDRNELNNLLLGVLDAPLVVLRGDDDGEVDPLKPFKWLKRAAASHHRYPNARCTLAYLQRNALV